MARIQRALAACHDAVARRTAVLQALQLRNGDHVLEVGCGGGLYAREAAKFVGSTGHVCAVDISDDQIAAAAEVCRDFAWVECQVADAAKLPFEAAAFDAVYGVQVLEYVRHLDQALAEIRRVLRPGGRLAVLATNWDSVVWFSQERERMARVLDANRRHPTVPNLPAILASRLRAVGLMPVGQQAVPIVNGSYNENSFSYWLAHILAHYCVEEGVLRAAEAKAWLAEFQALDQEGAYHFSLLPILTTAIKAV
jgi:SAM-dependent methyltransferase